MYKSLPTIMELRPKSIAARIFTDPKYEELGNALRERIKLENQCHESHCFKYLATDNKDKFEQLFKGYFPSLLHKECEENLITNMYEIKANVLHIFII